MYSVVLLAALTAGSTAPDFHNCHGCSGGGSCHGGGWGGHGGGWGCHGGCWGGDGCWGCYGPGCYGGYCYGYWSCSSCYGCYGWYGSYGALDCYSSYSCSGCFGCHGWYQCHGCYGGYIPSCAACSCSCAGGIGCYSAIGCAGCHGGGAAVWGYPGWGPVEVGPYGTPGTTMPYTAPGTTAPGDKMLPNPKKGETSLENRASLTVELPADAKLYVDDQPMKTTSSTRRFFTPPLPQGKAYYYELRAEMVRDGQTVRVSRRVVVRPGDDLHTSFPELQDADPATAKAGGR